ncbi:FAD-dependent oxidoreductase [Streptomyces sp. LaBMicrA B280]|uniref:FAD-dependent oxidoreductase n=1 Tax=Streptomyces sp. LaBMicrA B280 TaxID=3391001 RepID=UPI003BA7149D
MTPELDVAVVGAGIAGLTAAHELRRAGLSVRVYEQLPHVGGRMRSLRHQGWTVDTGAEQVASRGYRATWELLRRLGVTPADVPRVGGGVAVWRGGRAQIGRASCRGRTVRPRPPRPGRLLRLVRPPRRRFRRRPPRAHPARRHHRPRGERALPPRSARLPLPAGRGLLLRLGHRALGRRPAGQPAAGGRCPEQLAHLPHRYGPPRPAARRRHRDGHRAHRARGGRRGRARRPALRGRRGQGAGRGARRTRTRRAGPAPRSPRRRTAVPHRLHLHPDAEGQLPAGPPARPGRAPPGAHPAHPGHRGTTAVRRRRGPRQGPRPRPRRPRPHHPRGRPAPGSRTPGRRPGRGRRPAGPRGRTLCPRHRRRPPPPLRAHLPRRPARSHPGGPRRTRRLPGPAGARGGVRR